DAGVARGLLDDRRAGTDEAITLRRIEHAQRGAVLHAATRIGRLEFRDHIGVQPGADTAEAHERCVANEVEHRVGSVHEYLCWLLMAMTLKRSTMITIAIETDTLQAINARYMLGCRYIRG